MVVKPKTVEAEAEKKKPSSSPPPEGEFQLPDEYGDEFVEPPAPPPHEDVIPEAVVKTLADILVYTVDILHDGAADITGYQPWRLTDKEKEMWKLILVEFVPHLPLKYAVLIVTVISLSISEMKKVGGYMTWRAQVNKAVNVPASAPQQAAPQQIQVPPREKGPGDWLPPAPKEQLPNFEL